MYRRPSDYWSSPKRTNIFRRLSIIGRAVISIRTIMAMIMMLMIQSRTAASGRVLTAFIRTSSRDRMCANDNMKASLHVTPNMIHGTTAVTTTRRNKTIVRSHSHDTTSQSPTTLPSQRIRIMGGGLAGLSVAYHLLLSSQQQQRPPPPNIEGIDITVYDTAHDIGTGGASGIAGGYVTCFTFVCLLVVFVLSVILVFVEPMSFCGCQ